MLFSLSDAWAQVPQNAVPAEGQGETIPLRVGDKVPEEFWTQEHLFYKDGDTVRKSLSNYRGKWILMDFWASWCGPCLFSFHKLDRIREVFPEQISVVLVNSRTTKDNFTKIARVYRETKAKRLWKANIPSVMYDDYFSGMFPYVAVPFYVWINPKGYVYAFTRAEFVDINQVLNVLHPSL